MTWPWRGGTRGGARSLPRELPMPLPREPPVGESGVTNNKIIEVVYLESGDDAAVGQAEQDDC
jgi:hypothetical protein